MESKRGREANIELLRCLAMYLVVLTHYLSKTGGVNALEKGNLVYYLVWFIYNACGMGNNVLIIISGYFWRRTKVNMNKIANMWAIVWFYSVGFVLIAKFVLKIELTSGIKQAILPLTSGEYWYFTTYIGLYCLIPWLKILLDNISKDQFKHLMIVMTFLLSIIPTVFGCTDWLGDGGAYGIVWFVYLYLIGAFIEKSNINISSCISTVMLIVCLLIAPSYKFLLELFDLGEIYWDRIWTMYSVNMIHNLMASVFLFLWFKNIEIKNIYEKIVLYLGQGCLGVYLIHNNRNIAHYMWGKLNAYYWLVERKNLLVVMLICTIVFVGCNFMEHVRAYIFRKMCVDKCIDKVCVGITQKVGNI